jgi:hypothetical protein
VAAQLAAIEQLERELAAANNALKVQCDTCEIKTVFDADRRYAEKCKAQVADLEEQLNEADESIKTTLDLLEAEKARAEKAEAERDEQGKRAVELFDISMSLQKRLGQQETDHAFQLARKDEALRWLEVLSEDGAVAIGTVTDEENCVYRMSASGTHVSAMNVLDLLELHQVAHKRRRAAAALATEVGK